MDDDDDDEGTKDPLFPLLLSVFRPSHFVNQLWQNDCLTPDILSWQKLNGLSLNRRPIVLSQDNNEKCKKNTEEIEHQQ